MEVTQADLASWLLNRALHMEPTPSRLGAEGSSSSGGQQGGKCPRAEVRTLILALDLSGHTLQHLGQGPPPALNQLLTCKPRWQRRAAACSQAALEGIGHHLCK